MLSKYGRYGGLGKMGQSAMSASFITLFKMGWLMGFEPTNTRVTVEGLRPLGNSHHRV